MYTLCCCLIYMIKALERGYATQALCFLSIEPFTLKALPCSKQRKPHVSLTCHEVRGLKALGGPGDIIFKWHVTMAV